MARPLPEIVRVEWPAGRDSPPAATDAALDRAAEVLRRGGLVAIPTETVYGLAADALDEAAVDGIFRAKGRPATNPLIVHVADVAMARTLAARWPEAAERITAALWPNAFCPERSRSMRLDVLWMRYSIATPSSLGMAGSCSTLPTYCKEFFQALNSFGATLWPVRSR